MKKAGAVLLGIAAFAAIPALAHDDEGGNRFGGNLNGYQEVAATNSTLSTPGNGRFDLQIDGNQVHWRLSYADTETTVMQSHIHLGARGIAGGISVFFCTNLGNAPAGVVVQGCPPAPATISGTFTAADVIGPTGQGIAAGEFDELIRAIRAGATYANVHTVGRPSGEIRTQVRRGHSRGGDRDRD